MKRILCLLVACAVFMASAKSTHAQDCKAKPGDDAAVVQTIRTMFDAATNDNLAKFHSVAAPSFYMYDNGQRFDGDAIMSLIAGLHAKGAKLVWNVTAPDVHVDCDEAWIAYVNDGSVQMKPDAPITPMKWLESAVLRRINGQWKIVFLHSTREPAPAA